MAPDGSQSIVQDGEVQALNRKDLGKTAHADFSNLPGTKKECPNQGPTCAKAVGNGRQFNQIIPPMPNVTPK